jgi:hypothetical protein
MYFFIVTVGFNGGNLKRSQKGNCSKDPTKNSPSHNSETKAKR